MNIDDEKKYCSNCRYYKKDENIERCSNNKLNCNYDLPGCEEWKSSYEDTRIVSIDVLKVNYARQKICRCANPTYEIDYQNRIVYCTKCTAVIEPFEALYGIAKHYEAINNSVTRAVERRNELMRYKPHLRAIKSIESNIRSGKMLPICPKCNEMFKIEEVNTYGNKLFYKEETTK